VQLEALVMWAAVTAYAIGAVVFVVGYVFGVEKLVVVGLWAAALGLAAHTVGIAVRWERIGHGPYLGFYEVVSSYAWLAVAMFLLMAIRYPGLRVVGVILMPIAFLLMGGAMLAPKSGSEITPSLASWWLNIHVAFAKLSYATLVVAFGLGLVYIVRERGWLATLADVLSKLPRQEVIDDLIYKFVAVGFIFLGIMIAAGAIWANEAWGRYWAWDPIETWSLIAWIIYAVVLHLRLTMGWRGTRFAWAAVAALPVVLFALIGVPVVYQSIHGAYLLGT